MKSYLIFLVLTLGSALMVRAQSDGCAFDAYLRNISEQEQLKSERQEKSYRALLRSGKHLRQKSAYTIPVVVHIIHQNGPENLSDTEVNAAISSINEGLSNEGPFEFDGNEVVPIQLCMATRAPDGSPTSGIQRVSSSLTDVEMGVNSGDMKLLSHWDSRSYLNVWLVRSVKSGGSNTIAGYATLPSSHGAFNDGITMRYDRFSWTDIQVFLHEFGHYMGLYHTFQGGCKNDNCLEDGDKVCDTPPDGSSGIVGCGMRANTCNTDEDDRSTNNPFRPVSQGGLGDQNDPTNNNMDYWVGSCPHYFTSGQVDRMIFFMEEVRKSLETSKGCLMPCTQPVVADAQVADSILKESDVSIVNMSINATAYRWYINGSYVSAETDLTTQFLTEGWQEIRLEASNEDEACDTVNWKKEVYVYCTAGSKISAELRDTSQINYSCYAIEGTFEGIEIRDATGTVVYSSGDSTGVYETWVPGYYELCGITEDMGCQDTSCVFVRVYGDAEENCSNEQDDDGDGLVDGFDPDCPCVDNVYYAVCPINCEYTPAADAITMQIAWQYECWKERNQWSDNYYVSGDIDGDGEVEIIVKERSQDDDTNIYAYYNLLILNGADGTVENRIELLPYGNDTFGQVQGVPLIVDVDGDGEAELFNFACRARYGSFNIDGSLNYISDSCTVRISRQNGLDAVLNRLDIKATDFDGDGQIEVCHGTTICDALTGRTLVNNTFNLDAPFRLSQNSIVADVLDVPGKELIFGRQVYSVEINNRNGTSGNSLKLEVEVDSIFYNTTSWNWMYNSIADFDNDNNLDVLLARNDSYNSDEDEGGVWIFNPRTGEIMAKAEFTYYNVGQPSVGDVDRDCVPEIIVAVEDTLLVYKYDGSEDLKILYKKGIYDKSGGTGITLFDLNNDGKVEIIYRDERYLYVLEGATGRELAKMQMYHGTSTEKPIVIDVDQDGQAEIIVSGNLTDTDGDYSIFVIETAGAPWAPARPVWNQYAYHSTNINDDLTVPRVQQNMAKPLQGYEDCLRETCPAPYNGFLMQSTYRTQAGCVQFPAVDLSVEALGYDCGPDSTTFYLQVCNGSNGKSFREDYCISLYDDLSSPGYSEVFCLNQQVDTMGCSDTIVLRIPTPGSLDQLYFAVNDDGSAASPAAFPITNLVECNYQNNIDTLDLDISPRSLDLGPDISKCESEVMTLEAPSGFERYLWSDLTRDSLYSSAADGIHWLEATDQCDRVYRDTVAFSIDRQDELNLPDEFTGCPGDSIGLLVNGSDYESIQWFPSGAVACDTCFVTSLFIQDSITELIGVTQNGACVYVDTIVLQPTVGIEIEQTAEICEGDSLRFFDQMATEAATYRYTTADCDSSFVLELETLENRAFSYQEEICQGDSVLFDGLWRYTEGQYTQMLTAANGCDSVLTLELELLRQDTSALTEALCEGDTLQVAGEKYTQAGDYELRALNHFGCDSLIRLSLAVYDKDTLSLEREYCSGDSLLFDGRWYTSPDTYELMYENSYGCDSLVRLQVTEVDTLKEQAEYLLCPGDSVEVAGQWIDQSGVYPFALTSLAGCDSSFTAEVEVLLSPERPTTEIDCEAGLAILSLA